MQEITADHQIPTKKQNSGVETISINDEKDELRVVPTDNKKTAKLKQKSRVILYENDAKNGRETTKIVSDLNLRATRNKHQSQSSLNIKGRQITEKKNLTTQFKK